MKTLKISLDDKVLVKAEIDIEAFTTAFGLTQTGAGQVFPKSKPVTVQQARDLISRVNEKSAQFLREVAQRGGSITWGEMREIFGIADPEDFTPFTNGFGRGITRALRHITGDTAAILFFWEEPWPDDQDSGHLFIDGQALESIKHA